MGSRKVLRDKRKAGGLCVECGGMCDRIPKTLCSKCAPEFAAVISAYHRRLKVAAFEAYGGTKCQCCNEQTLEFLTIDHIDGSGAKHRKELRGGDGYGGGGGVRLYLWLKRHSYPRGFRVLCMNCNFARGMYGMCPHEPWNEVVAADQRIKNTTGKFDLH